MAALVCDLCGGKLVMGAGGIAVCDSCGMEHSADRMKEKVQEIKGTVRVDNSHMVENYLEMAESAKEAGNNAEAESYCNKVIEIEPTNYKAWMLKGEAVAWQSSLKDSRIDEGIAAFVKAINNAPDEAREDLVEEAKEQIKNLSLATILLRADRFAKWPDEEESQGLISDIASALIRMTKFLAQFGKEVLPSEIMALIATRINQAVSKAYSNVIWPEYNGNPHDPNDKASKSEWEKFIKRVDCCIYVLERAIILYGEDCEDDKIDILFYENQITLQQAAIDSCSWDYKFINGGKYWYKNWMLTDEAKNLRRNSIRDCQTKIREIRIAKAKKEKEEAKKRVDDYWAEHADEKTALETERAALEDKIASLRNEINSIPGDAEKKNIRERIDTLNEEYRSLGLFKGKEKKTVQEKIDAANLELKTIIDRMYAAKKEIEEKIAPLQQRIKEITAELTKAR